MKINMPVILKNCISFYQGVCTSKDITLPMQIHRVSLLGIPLIKKFNSNLLIIMT